MNRGSFQPSSYYEQLPLRRNCRCSCHRTGAIHVAPCCRGSVVFEDSAYGDAGGGKSKKKVSKPCQKAAEDHEKYLRLMWKATVFSAERVKYEKKASEAAKKLDSCHDTAKGGAGFGFPKESPIKLWSMPPASRPVEVGLNLTGDPADMIVSAAKGFAPTIAASAEYRGEIAGGLVVLHLLGVPGYETINPDTLQPFVALTLSPKDNSKLLRMMGARGDDDKALESAARTMRTKIAKLGKGAVNTAFATRALYMIGASGAITAAKGLAVGVVSAIPLGVTQIIGAVSGAIMAAESAMTQAALGRMKQLLAEGQAQMATEAAQAEAGVGVPPRVGAPVGQSGRTATGTGADASGTELEPTGKTIGGIPLIWIGVAGVAVLGGLLLFQSNRRSS